MGYHEICASDNEGNLVTIGKPFDETPWIDAENDAKYEELREYHENLGIIALLDNVFSEYSGLTETGSQIAFLRKLDYSGANVSGIKGVVDFDVARGMERGKASINAMYQRTMGGIKASSENPSKPSKLVTRVLQASFS